MVRPGGMAGAWPRVGAKVAALSLISGATACAAWLVWLIPLLRSAAISRAAAMNGVREGRMQDSFVESHGGAGCSGTKAMDRARKPIDDGLSVQTSRQGHSLEGY